MAKNKDISAARQREAEAFVGDAGIPTDLHIERVIIKNFRNIKDLDKEIKGANILLIGENTVGKSNFIDAIEIGLGMSERVGVDPVSIGETDSEIKIITSDGSDKRFEFRARLKAGRDKVYFQVKAPDGLRDETQSVIGGIVGEINFDIDEFIRLSETAAGRREQVDIVKSFQPAEIIAALNRYEAKAKNLFDDRTEINREIKQIDGFLKQSGFNPLEFDKFKDPVPIEELNEKLSKAIALNESITKVQTGMDQMDKKMSENIDEAAKLRARLEAIEKENEELRLKRESGDAWLKKYPRVEIKSIQDEIALANQHNATHEKMKVIRAQEAKLRLSQDQAGDLTAQYETTVQLIQDTIRDMEMPIEGLTFDSEKLYLNGIPVDDSTMSTSEKMMLGVRLKIAKNPNAKVLFIQRGESLGTQKLRDLQEMAKKYNFQIIMEQMQRGISSLQIEIMPEI